MLNSMPNVNLANVSRANMSLTNVSLTNVSLTNVSLTNMSRAALSNLTNLTDGVTMDPETVKKLELLVRIYGWLDSWQWLIKYLLGLIVLAGFLANVSTIVTIICRKLYRKSAIFVFFVFIGTNDVLYNIFCGFTESFEAYTGINVFLKSEFLCAFRFYIVTSSSTASSWLLLAASTYKLYVMVYPMEVFKRDNTKMAQKISVSVMGIFYIAFLHLFWVSGRYDKHNVGLTECFIKRHDFPLYGKAFGLINMILYVVIPGGLLIVTSSGMIYFFNKSYQMHKQLVQSGGEIIISPTYKAAKITILTLLPLTIFFILITLPCLVFVWIVYMTCTNINHAMNPYVQFLISGGFRSAMLGRDGEGAKMYLSSNSGRRKSKLRSEVTNTDPVMCVSYNCRGDNSGDVVFKFEQ